MVRKRPNEASLGQSHDDRSHFDDDPAVPPERAFPLGELRSAALILGSLLLLLTAWVVSDNLPGTATSVWPWIFACAALLYLGPAIVLINLDQFDEARLFALAEAIHLALAAGVVALATRGFAGSAYSAIGDASWLTLAGCALLAVPGAAIKALRRRR